MVPAEARGWVSNAWGAVTPFITAGTILCAK